MYKVYDPVAMDYCRRTHPELGVEYAAGPEEVVSGSDALVLVTEWKEFIRLPFARLGELMRQKVIIDGRNVLDRRLLQDAGFTYIGIGR